MKSEPRFLTPLLAFLLFACIACLWIPLLFESLWTDETVTAFILRHGAGHPSLAASPRLDQTVYYWLPRGALSIFGFSEMSLRLPSLLASLLSLRLIGKVAGRLIHPGAAWIAVFIAFIPREFTRQATDARPYGFGTCISLAAMWFLVRWLDRGRWHDAMLFILFAALLLRIHLVYWPFYAVFVCYGVLRVARNETPVSVRSLALTFALAAATLIPLVRVTFGIFHEEKLHVVAELPNLRDISTGLRIPIVAACAIGFWLLGRVFRTPYKKSKVTLSTVVLLAAWWLWQPLCLLAASWITRNSVFVPRYFSLALPGMMMMCAFVASRFLPDALWKPAACVLALGILCVGVFKSPFPPTRDSHWREAAARVNRLSGDQFIAVFCPSPFVEARSPVWSPAYALPGFFYAPLDVYPVWGNKVLLPVRPEPEAERYAMGILRSAAIPTGRFVVYGGIYSVNLWTDWLYPLPELSGWNRRYDGLYGEAGVMIFER